MVVGGWGEEGYNEDDDDGRTLRRMGMTIEY